MGSILGNRVLRVEDPRLLTGGGTYVEDVDLPDAAWLTYVRSPLAHATIEPIDVADAHGGARRRSPSSPAPTSPSSASRRPRNPACPRGDAPAVRRRRHACATSASRSSRSSPRTAPSAMRRRRPRARRLRPAAGRDRRRSSRRRDEVLLFPDAGTNVVHRAGDAGARRLRRAARSSSSERIVNQRLTAAPIEPPLRRRLLDRRRAARALLGVPGRPPDEGDCSPRSYGLEPSQVRVIVPDVGGGFGAKSRTYPEELALGFYARAVGRPVRWTETRSENMVAMPHGRGPGAARHASAAPATAASPPTSSTSCRTPAPTR